MKALHSWLLTEGAHGMISQVEGLANGLNSTFEHKFIKLSYFSRFLPPIFTPRVPSLFNFEELMSGVNSCPDYIISCGRKSVIPNLVIKKYLKEKFNKKVKNIHIQDPKISASNFDYIIVPEHDNKVSGDNIIYSKGALHYLSEKEVLNTNKGDLILSLILGGPNKYYSFSYDELKNIFFYLRNNQDLKKINIVASRRTPQEIFKKLQLEFSEPQI
jgi:mitochondrial fission protein ELM1